MFGLKKLIDLVKGFSMEVALSTLCAYLSINIFDDI